MRLRRIRTRAAKIGAWRAPALASVICIATMSAAPHASAELGPAHTGLTAGANTAATAAFNPAGMTRIAETEAVGDILVFYTESDFELKEGSSEGAGTTVSNDGLGAIPGAFLVKPLSDDWRLGLSLSVPTGFGSDWGETWAGRYIVQESTWFVVRLMPAVAYRVNGELSVGAGLTLDYTAADSSSAVRNLDGSDGQATLETDGWALGFSLSALYQFSPRTRAGIVYTSENEPELEGTPEFTNVGPAREALLRAAGIWDQTIEVTSRTPQVLQTGVWHDLAGDISLMADLVWVDFSRFGGSHIAIGENTAVVNPEYKDIWAASIGVEWPLAPTWRGAAGALYVSPGADDENRSLSLPLDRIYGLGIGVKKSFAKGRSWRLNLNYYDLGEAPIDTAPTPGAGRVVGDFSKKWSLGLDVNLQWRF